MSVAYISHPSCLKHEMGMHHPEQPARLHAINDRLVASGLGMVLHMHDAIPATREQLLLAHEPEYVESVFNTSPEDGHVWLDPDTAMNPFTLEAALLAAGAVVQAVDLVMQTSTRQAFCAVRPPGHHAERGRSMGFCIFNNIAIGAYHALQQHGLDRVAIVDFDVHHGNGTEDIVSGDQRVLFCSTFQHPFYPHSGYENCAENVHNVPLVNGSDGEAFREAVYYKLLPHLREFEPELILISAGFDAHQADDMAGLNLIDDDYRWVTQKLFEIAQQSAQGRVVSSLEGGYELHALARSVEAHIRAFYGE